jgi:hypothetical protein
MPRAFTAPDGDDDRDDDGDEDRDDDGDEDLDEDDDDGDWLEVGDTGGLDVELMAVPASGRPSPGSVPFANGASTRPAAAKPTPTAAAAKTSQRPTNA